MNIGGYNTKRSYNSDYDDYDGYNIEDAKRHTEESRTRFLISRFVFWGDWFIVTPVFAAINARLGGVIFGLILAVAGGITYTDKNLRTFDKRINSLLVIITGLMVSVWSMSFVFILNAGYERHRERGVGFTTTGILLIILAIVYISLPMVEQNLRKKRCSYSTTAVCTELLESHATRKPSYAAIWEYEVFGRTARKQDLFMLFNYPSVNDMKVINVDPDDPQDIYRDNGSMILIGWIAGLTLIGLSIFLLSRGLPQLAWVSPV